MGIYAFAWAICRKFHSLPVFGPYFGLYNLIMSITQFNDVISKRCTGHQDKEKKTRLTNCNSIQINYMSKVNEHYLIMHAQIKPQHLSLQCEHFV